MTEHIERYHDFATFLAEHGYYVVGHDHLGHGKSVASAEKLGFFHETHGNEFVIADIHQLRMQDMFSIIHFLMKTLRVTWQLDAHSHSF